ncbi:helix-turn-helix domain-containing protein, partial [Methylotuvimicrobium sp.]|uniref:helix-turn-helix domain-containing protein n=1 Tax=Methylotuvimicrobium sp. TaxID=2822413 RepID=UPI003D65648A
MSRCLVFCLRLRYSRRLRQNTRRYGYRGLKIFTSLALRFQDFQRLMGLHDHERLGRPPRITEEEMVALEKDLEQAP